jgi:hypothetical protein
MGQPSLTSVIPRILHLECLLEKESHFLLGPRQIVKSFKSFPESRVYDLLDTSVTLGSASVHSSQEQERRVAADHRGD